MFIDSATLLNHRLCDVEGVLHQASTPLADITLIDLVHDFNHNGIYVFGWHLDGHCAEHWQPMYVGKSSSRLFFERLAGHFDTRDDAVMNSMLKKIHRSLVDRTVTLHEVAAEIMQSGTIVTIRHDNGPETLKLEKVLCHTLGEKIINKPSKPLPVATIASMWHTLHGKI